MDFSIVELEKEIKLVEMEIEASDSIEIKDNLKHKMAALEKSITDFLITESARVIKLEKQIKNLKNELSETRLKLVLAENAIQYEAEKKCSVS